jgi:hypothetical protein
VSERQWSSSDEEEKKEGGKINKMERGKKVFKK